MMTQNASLLYVHNLKIVKYPDPILKQFCLPVVKFDFENKAIADKMVELMIENDGIGLAANQVGLTMQMFVMYITGISEKPKVFINPKIVFSNGTINSQEGCLSCVGITKVVQRKKAVRLSYQDLNGTVCVEKFFDREACCIQHEIDHLQGKLLIS